MQLKKATKEHVEHLEKTYGKRNVDSRLQVHIQLEQDGMG